jgi:hypothetical protein
MKLAIRWVFSSLVLLASTPTVIAKEDADREFHKLFDGRVAEMPVRCVDLRRGCPAARVGLTLLTNPSLDVKLCEGDVVGLVDLNTNVAAGSCRLGPWTPYRKSR